MVVRCNPDNRLLLLNPIHACQRTTTHRSRTTPFEPPNTNPSHAGQDSRSFQPSCSRSFSSSMPHPQASFINEKDQSSALGRVPPGVASKNCGSEVPEGNSCQPITALCHAGCADKSSN